MLSKGSRSPAPKPDLISRIAERITIKDDIPKPLLTAFDRLLAAAKPPSGPDLPLTGTQVPDVAGHTGLLPAVRRGRHQLAPAYTT
jgi:hypothetical protein